MQISELSQKTGVSLRSLRYYEEKHLLSPVRRGNGYREYAESDIEKVGMIQLYFGLGLTVGELTDLMDCIFGSEIRRECLPNAMKVGERKLRDIRSQIEKLRNAERQLEENMIKWEQILKRTEEPG